MDCIEIARLRLDRAIEHIREFNAEAGDFFKGSPFGIESKFYSEGGQDCVSYHFQVYKEIPQRLGIIAGECVHNLRAILDNIIWSLGELYPPVDERISFPIAKDPTHYQDLLKKPSFKGINNFPSTAQDLIQNLQPYKGVYAGAVQTHPLSILNNMWNADKHRTPTVMLAVVGGVDFNGSLGSPANAIAGPGMAVEDGAKFAWGGLPQGGPRPDKQPKVSVHIALGVGHPARVLAANYYLSTVHDFIRDKVVAKFEPIFRGGGKP